MFRHKYYVVMKAFRDHEIVGTLSYVTRPLRLNGKVIRELEDEAETKCSDDKIDNVIVTFIHKLPGWWL